MVSARSPAWIPATYVHEAHFMSNTLAFGLANRLAAGGPRDLAEPCGFPLAPMVGQAGSVSRVGSSFPAAGWSALTVEGAHNGQHPKYLAISGGHPCLFGADTLVAGKPAILAERECDTLLLWQEAGHLVGVATLGRCNRGVSARALRYVLGGPRLLVACDVDADGDKSAERLRQLSPRRHRIRPPVGKDVTAFWQAGGRVRDWVQFELARLLQRSGRRLRLFGV